MNRTGRCICAVLAAALLLMPGTVFAAGNSRTAESKETVSPMRAWKLRLIESKEARFRVHREALLKARLKVQLLSDGFEMTDDTDVYYICDNGVDYIAAVSDGRHHVYQVCVTRSGEYFLASDTLNEAVISHVMLQTDEDSVKSSEEFWNHVMLRDPPQTAYGVSQDRPRDANGVMMVPYYNQGRGYCVNGTWLYPEWASATFNVNGHTMHQAGCGFFSTAMALSYVMQRVISPVEFKENGQYIADQGSAVTVGVVSAAMYGVDAYITGDINEVLMALRNGQPVMEHVGSAPFTSEGHYILLVGVLPDGTIAVNDPGHMDNTYWYCGVSWPVDVILGAAKNITTAFTVFG